MKRNRTDEEKIEAYIRKYGVTLCPPCRSEELKVICFEKARLEDAEARGRYSRGR